MFAIKSGFLIFLLFSLFDCNSTVKTESINTNRPHATGTQVLAAGSEEIPKDLSIELQRTSCYGTCPSYNLSVKSDGSVTFEGIGRTKVKGKVKDKISLTKIKQLIAEFDRADFFDFADKYDSSNCPVTDTDMPGSEVSYQINGRKKSVVTQFGCSGGDERFQKTILRLTNLENRIDEIVETKRWIGK